MSREHFKAALQAQRRARIALDRYNEGDRVTNISTGKMGVIDRVLGSERYNVRYISGVLTQRGDQLEPWKGYDNEQAKTQAFAVQSFGLPTYGSGGWTGGDSRTLYAFRDKRTGALAVRPGGQTQGIGPECDVSVATRDEAERGWQSPLSKGWTVSG